MSKIDIAGLKVDAVGKKELLAVIQSRVIAGQKTWITTPYSEFLYAGLCDSKIMEMLTQADFAVADGIGIFWAAKFLSIPLTAKSYYGKILQGLWQIKYSLAAIVFNLRWIKSAFPEKISGSDLIWDLTELAVKNNFSVFLLGGFSDTPALVAEKLLTPNPQLKVAGTSSKNPNDPTVLEDIKKSNADFLFVAYGPIKQESWINAHKDELPCKLYIGLGGAFDYIAGKRVSPPKFIRSIGLEWLYRLITQPYRIKRVFNATFGLITTLLRFKIFASYPMRENVVGVILNLENKVLLGKKKPQKFNVDIIDNADAQKRQNYWQFPQGGTDGETDLVKAARKEIKEEIGIENLELIKISSKHYSYPWNNALRKLSKNNAYKNKGQNQSLVYFRLTEGINKITLPENEEFSQYQWVPINDLLKIVHPERWPVAKIVQEDLKDLA